jgi:hypothetical protein
MFLLIIFYIVVMFDASISKTVIKKQVKPTYIGRMGDFDVFEFPKHGKSQRIIIFVPGHSLGW